MPKPLITILCILFLVPAKAQLVDSTFYIRLSQQEIIQQSETDFEDKNRELKIDTTRLPLEQIKQIRYLGIACTDCSDSIKYSIHSYELIARPDSLPFFLRVSGAKLPDLYLNNIKPNLSKSALLLFDRVRIVSNLDEQPLRISHLFILPE